ncbi:thiamine-phosphate pyrophosphorylase [bacterium]
MLNNDRNIYRTIDVNANRVKEGLRVIEEYFRFFEENNGVMLDIREMRHRINSILKNVYSKLLESRRIDTDYGKDIKEGNRDSISDTITANCKRVQEGLRVLEEFSKILGKEIFSEFKDMRFRMYNL